MIQPVVIVDPAVRFGQPHIKGTPTDAIAGMIRAGEPFPTVADEYDLTVHEVVLACWYEGTHGRYTHCWRTWANEIAPALGGWQPLNTATIPEPPRAGCGHELCGADGGPCPNCGYDVQSDRW